jgi:hypothetical protein
MPSVIPGVHIKPTNSVLIIRVVVLTGFCFILAEAGNAATGGGKLWLFLVILWPPGVAVAIVIHSARLTTTGDVLTYKGPLQTRAWQREEIANFWLDKSWGAHTENVHIEMETAPGEQVVFSAIEASLLFNRREPDRWLATLRDWLEAADEPSVG